MDVVDVQHKGQLPAHLPVFSGIREVTLTILPDIELCSPLVQVRQKRIQVELMARQATSHGYHCQAGSSWRAIKPVSHACHIHITSKMLQGKVRNTQDTAHRIWNIQRSSSPHIQQPGALCPVQQLLCSSSRLTPDTRSSDRSFGTGMVHVGAALVSSAAMLSQQKRGRSRIGHRIETFLPHS